MNDTEDAKTELLRRIWHLVGERREVISKRDDLREIVDDYSRNGEADADTAATAQVGMYRLEKTIAAGLQDVDKLILEALELFAGPPNKDADDGEVPT